MFIRQYKELPKKIHFIWVGGSLPEEYFTSLQRLANVVKMSDFEVNLWVNDEKNFLQPLQKKLLDSIFLPKNKEVLGIKIRNIDELIDTMEDIFTEDLLKKYLSYINRELIGHKNLAAASDLLRYIILFIEGGYYLDTDIIFNFINNLKYKNTLSSTTCPQFIADKPFFGFLSSVDIQDPEITEERFLKAHIQANNNIIGSLPEHPILKATIELILKKYPSNEKRLILKLMKPLPSWILSDFHFPKEEIVKNLQ